jgi:hypothetical protein
VDIRQIKANLYGLPMETGTDNTPNDKAIANVEGYGKM